jgi:hypothetical protein
MSIDRGFESVEFIMFFLQEGYTVKTTERLIARSDPDLAKFISTCTSNLIPRDMELLLSLCH